MKTNIYPILRMAILVCIGWIIPQTQMAQNYFQKVFYDSPYDQEGQDIIPMPDGGYLIPGYTTNSRMNDMDVQVIKTDASGNQVWKRTYGGTSPDFGNRALACGDGNYFVIGYSQSYSSGDYDVLLLKIDPTGNVVWQKTYGSWGNDQGSDIIATSDGNFMIIGNTNSGTTLGGYDFYMVKIDPAGNVLWSRTLGGSAGDWGTSIKQTPDGGYAVLGITFSYGAGGDALLIKTDANGNEQWHGNFGGGNYDEGVYVAANTDGTIAFLVRDSSMAGKDIDVRIVKTDASGSVLWNKSYGGPRKDTPKMIQPTMDGGYIVAAITRSFGLVNPDMWMMKFDGNGDTLWTRKFGGTGHEHCYTARELPSGDYILSGKTESYSPDMEVMIVKTNSMGTFTMGTQELLALQKELQVYPNPAIANLSVDVTGLRASSVSVMDLTGRELYNLSAADKSKIDIDMSGYSAGVYFVAVRTEDKTVTRKFILK